MNPNIGHERQLTFFPYQGHDHDGINSTPVKLANGQVGIYNLSPSVLEYIKNIANGGIDLDGDNNVRPVPDLLFETTSVGPGGVATGTVPWVGLAIVRYTRILMSAETEARVTFYHKPTFLDEDREFRAEHCTDKFLWEGNWAHFDEADAKSIYYKIENTGSVAASFKMIVKSGTMAANAYARFIESLQVQGSSDTPALGNVLLKSGNGVAISFDANSNSFTFNARAPETVYIKSWALSPLKPTAFTTSAGSITNVSYLSDGYTHDTNRYVQFGSGSAWLQADLGAVKTIGAVQAIPYFGDGRIQNDGRIQLSPDGTSWVTFRSSQAYWSTGEGAWAHISNGYQARYIRYWSNGTSIDTNNYLVKLIAYGLSDKQG